MHVEVIIMVYNVTLKDGLIVIDDEEIKTDIVFGINPIDFLYIHEKLNKKGFRINRIRFNHKEVGLSRSDIRIMKENLTKDIISFEILCNELLNHGTKIEPLIYQFNDAQKNPDIHEIRHTLSLGRLGYEYLVTGHSVEFLPNIGEGGSDLKIDDLSVELKVRKELDLNLRLLDYYQIYKFKSGIYYTLKLDILEDFVKEVEKAERSRAQKSLEQASVIFVDLSYVIKNFPEDQDYFDPPTLANNKWIFYISELSHFKPRWRHVWASTYYNPETFDFHRSDDGSIIWE